MTVLLLAAISALGGPAFRHSGTAYAAVWQIPELRPVQAPSGETTGWAAAGCGFSGEDCDILLPRMNVFLPIPPGSEPVIRVEALGTAAMDGPVRRVLPSGGGDEFIAADPSGLPRDWGELEGISSFRGFSLARVSLYPVILSGGSLLAASSLRVVLDHGSASRPAAVTGAEGDLLRLLTGTDRAWRGTPRGATRESPFMGLPWARIGVDTAGVHAVTGDMIPQACGSFSSTLSMFTGRGRMMGPSPWDSTYSPRAVPILVSDGGDGTFDEADSIYFFARGLSWWASDGDSLPDHFMHQFSGRNVYWLTWGGEPGARMDILDAGQSGAPVVQGDLPARLHFETDVTRKPDLVPGDWVWDSALGSGTQWFYHEFSIPDASDGFGTVRLSLYATDPGDHRVVVQINQTTIADAAWTGVGALPLTAPAFNLHDGPNTLSIGVVHNPSSDDVFMDWFEVFPHSSAGFHGEGQVQIPIERLSPGMRHRIDWDGSLDGAMLFATGSDTTAALLEGWTGSSFEIDIPAEWTSREIWAVPPGGVMTPASIEYAEPGRLLAWQGGAERLYIHPAGYLDDVETLLDPAASNATVSLEEIYDEFDGGVRDPYAVVAFLDYVLDNWDPVPVDVILCGSGHFDPRNRLSSRISLIDALHSPGDFFQDDIYAMTEGADLPQFAVSRICTSERSGFAAIASRSQSYRSGEYGGTWQTRVIGAADDERSSKSSFDEPYHTDSMEYILEHSLPAAFRPVKHYLIFYPFDDLWKKPEARADFIELWSEGALMVSFLGHGSFDQLADEGLFYMEDVGLLENSDRLPVAFFGSCRVGQFQDPAWDCLAQSVTTAPLGGAIAGIGATFDTAGTLNEALLAAFTEAVLSGDGASMASCLLAAKLSAGYSGLNNRVYVMFGDGSTPPALPGAMPRPYSDTLRTGEPAAVDGECPGTGPVLIEAFESARMQTYYTFRQGLPIDYMDMGARFFSGSAAAGPGYSASMFVPADADTGSAGRITAVLLAPSATFACALFPHPVIHGNPSAADSTGPSIELWIDGFRETETPTVSGPVAVEARLSDPSGIDLIGNPGRQLVLYVDGSPVDVSGSFTYDPGSATDGGLEVLLGTLPAGAHSLELAASDGLLNRSSAGMDFDVVASDGPSFGSVFAYPCPATDGVSINWDQSGSEPVDLDIYTISGRRIHSERNLRCTPGYNQYWWDCNDRDGDPVASGSYIFRISAGDAEACGILALVR